MAPIIPHWIQPSHPEIQQVVYANNNSDDDIDDGDTNNNINKKKKNDETYSTKSFSRIDLPPFAEFAKFTFPPCTIGSEQTYATVQVGRDSHMNLNSDLLYINHSCDPSVFFDITQKIIRAGPLGLHKGQELTFFYPSTEWTMDQSFLCHCNTTQCLGRISGARELALASIASNPSTTTSTTTSKTDSFLSTKYWLNDHIRDLIKDLVDQHRENVDHANANANGNGKENEDTDIKSPC